MTSKTILSMALTMAILGSGVFLPMNGVIHLADATITVSPYSWQMATSSTGGGARPERFLRGGRLSLMRFPTCAVSKRLCRGSELPMQQNLRGLGQLSERGFPALFNVSRFRGLRQGTSPRLLWELKRARSPRSSVRFGRAVDTAPYSRGTHGHHSVALKGRYGSHSDARIEPLTVNSREAKKKSEKSLAFAKKSR